jgi:hypothetical protein
MLEAIHLLWLPIKQILPQIIILIILIITTKEKLS